MLGSEYKIKYKKDVVEKDIPSLPKMVKLRVKTAIETKLVFNPIEFGKPLRYSLSGYRRLRVGDYRVVFRIEPNKTEVTIVAIKHHKKIYD